MKTILLTVLIVTIMSITDPVYGRNTRGKNNIGLMPFPRVGRAFNGKSSVYYLDHTLKPNSTKEDKQMERNMIPYPRVGRTATIADNYVLVPIKDTDYSKNPDTITDKFLTYGFIWKDDDIERDFISNAL